VRHSRPSTIIVADGFSCREQISQKTARHALHLAQVIHMAQNDGSSGDSKMYPETKIVADRNAARRKARGRAFLVLAGVALGGVLLRKLVTER
jgi:ferric-dicitrate binding protein FerR (iron transport regulator)